MAKANLSKLEYLKKYMDGNDNKKEKKSKKKKKGMKVNNIKIIDNAISLKSIDNTMDSEDEGQFDLQEEKPIMYAEDGTTLIDEMKPEDSSRWKPMKTNSTKVQKLPSKNTRRHDSSDSDQSPERKNTVKPPRKSQRHDSSDSDLSPVRQSRPRHDTSDSDVSPVRRKPCKSDKDFSPVRKKHNNSDCDMSPPRSKYKNNSVSSSKRQELKPEVISAGKSGLRTGSELREENERKRKHERDVIKNLGNDVSGKGADTVVRDRKTGRKVDLKLEAIKKRKLEEEQLEHNEKYAKWGKGVLQDENYQKQLKDDIHEMDKPLARYKDDKDLDVLLRERDRDGDPMLAFLNKAKDNEKAASKPRYNGPTPPPNRFNILPGYRFDGVDRSNGFEKRRFLEINKRKTHKEAAYKWSVEEM